MNSFRRIREHLGLTQTQLGEAIGMSQGNVSFLERGQTVLPDVARRLIDHAASLGYALTFDHVYGDAPLPAKRQRRARKSADAAA